MLVNITITLIRRGGVLEDVLGLEDRFWSSWPLASKVKSLALSSKVKSLALASKVKSLALALASRASSPRQLACPRLEDSTIFWIVKILWSAWKNFWKTFFRGDRLRNFCKDLFFFFLEIAWKNFREDFFFFFWKALALVFLVLGLGLEHYCPWPRECLSSERLSLASDFFCVLGLGLGLEPCVPRLHLC